MLFFVLRAAIARGNDGLSDIATMTFIALLCGLGFAALLLCALVRLRPPQLVRPSPAAFAALALAGYLVFSVFDFQLTDDEMNRISRLKRPNARLINEPDWVPRWD